MLRQTQRWRMDKMGPAKVWKKEHVDKSGKVQKSLEFEIPEFHLDQ